MTSETYKQRAVVVKAFDTSLNAIENGVKELNHFFDEGYIAFAHIHIREGAAVFLLEKGERPESGEEWRQGRYDTDPADFE